jgi:hypothetical protein
MTYAEYSMEMSNYKPFTTYYDDLTIAEHFGKDAIVDTVKRALKHNLGYKYLTELCMTLNHKCWIWYGRNNSDLSELYGELYYFVKDWCLDHFTEEENEYFFQIMD